MVIKNNFLESSTIHGLVYIATSKKYVRLFWIFVVFSGFTGAGYMIYKSYHSWNESPVKTTIETHPITDIIFPTVTVCPPRNTYTDLNYDLIILENTTLDNDTRKELANYAVDLFNDHLYDIIIKNLSKLKDNDRYYNWYHGYSDINIPSYNDFDGLNYWVSTAATSGIISTQHFGENFDADKVETKLYYSVDVYPPENVIKNPNVTLHFEIERISMKGLLYGHDSLQFGWDEVIENIESQNYTPPGYSRYISLTRFNVIPSDVNRQKLNLMPGFRFKWYYSGAEVVPEPKYKNSMFIRNNSMVAICYNYLT